MYARILAAPQLSEVPGFGYFTPIPATKSDLTPVQRANPVTPLDQMYAYFTAE